MGLEMIFTLNADGTAESFDGELYESGTWKIENDTIVVGEGIEGTVPMTVNAAGQLVMEEDDVKLIFSKSDDVSIVPEASMDSEAPAADMTAQMNERMEIKYVCTTAEVEGMTLQASMLGGEYALTFHADGTVDFVMVGMTISGLPWTLNDGAIRIDYYGTIMEATLTEAGFDLNYFDTMLMHLLPEN